MDYELRKLGQDEYWWPRSDHTGWANISWSLSELDIVLPKITHKRLAVQAGGNCGLWPVRLAQDFDRVVTFEPAPFMYDCLQENIRLHHAWNIDAHRAALSDRKELLELVQHNTDNLGASFITNRNKYEAMGHTTAGVRVRDISSMRIDDLELTACDFIQLDIEGYEQIALLGAEETIRRYRPVVMLEINGCGTAYGYEDGDTIRYMRSRGYQLSIQFNENFVFLPVDS